MYLSKKKKIVLIIAILSTIIVSFMGGQAYSKYVSEVKGEGVAEVATWSFKVNGQKELVQAINLASTCNNGTLLNHKLAPGSSGDFNIAIDGTGAEVGIDYQIQFLEESNKPRNLKFIYEGTQYNSITELENVVSGKIYADEENKEKIVNIKWKWDYETGENEIDIAKNDAIDTVDAQTIENYTFNIVVSGTQMIPQND